MKTVEFEDYPTHHMTADSMEHFIHMKRSCESRGSVVAYPAANRFLAKAQRKRSDARPRIARRDAPMADVFRKTLVTCFAPSRLCESFWEAVRGERIFMSASRFIVLENHHASCG